MSADPKQAVSPAGTAGGTAFAGVADELRARERHLAMAFDSARDMMMLAKVEPGELFRVISVNRPYLETVRAAGFHVGARELEGRTFAEVIRRFGFDATTVAQIRERYEEVIRTARPLEYDEITVTAVGTFYGRSSITPVLDANGRCDYLLYSSQDVTARVQAEQAQRESEAKFKTAFRVSPDCMSISDYETGRYLEINSTFESFFGFTREEVLGRTPLEVGMVHGPETREEFLRRFEADGHVQDYRMAALTRDGRTVVISVSAGALTIDGRKCVLRISRDVTAAVRAEQALRESEEKFARAFQSSPVALTIVELATGRFVEVNDAFTRLSGFARAEVLGRTTLELGIWSDPGERQAFVDRLEQDGLARDLVLTLTVREGRKVVARTNSDLLQLNGVRCILSVLDDITEQRRAEREKAALEEQLRQNQKLEALGTLAGGIAHDFNNILTAIIMNQQLAAMDAGESENLRRRLQEIGRASARAKELVRHILTFSRQQPHRKLRQSLQPTVAEALSLVRASLPASIEISPHLSAEAPPVLVDATQIHQVVMNLCTNAAHAMRERGGRLSVRLAGCAFDETAGREPPGLRPGSYARLTVADTGHGMEAAVLARIFEPFFTTKGPGEGTGLGLALVHGITRDHGGSIFVKSEPGAGTTFDLYFPEAIEPEGTPPAPAEEIFRGRGESVLVVDDEPAIGEVIGAMLDRLGYRTEICTDTDAALARLDSAPEAFDLLLTDRTMPRLNGAELIARARVNRPGLAAVLMSGQSGAGNECAEATLSYAMLAKPIDLAQLSRAVRCAIDAANSAPA